MLKNKLTFFILIGLLFTLLVVLQHFVPRPIDWRINFRDSSKSPYGCYIIKDMLPLLEPGKKISKNDLSLYEAENLGDLKNESLMIVTDRFSPDKFDLAVLLDLVSSGNTVFISAFDFGTTLSDTLKLKVHSPFIDTSAFRKGKEVLNFLNPALKIDSGYVFKRKMPSVYFTSFDSLHTKQLGIDRSGKTNFITTSFGNGKLLLHCQPMAFTNFHVLYGNADYSISALAYLGEKDIVWDNYYKPGRMVNTSPVRYILSQPALRSAYYLTLLTILLYMIFEGKRRQRKIPIVKPPQNSSLQFIQTIGKLYFKSKNHGDLARKKATYFKDFLRERYYLTTINSEKKNLQLIASKSGVKYEAVEEIILNIESIKQQQNISQTKLLNFHTKIENFYSTCI